LPVDIDGLSCVGVTVDVTEAAWRETCRVLLVDRTVLEWNGVAPPLLSAQKRIARAG
jgi:hypothetical protein